jgi:hypothetical protein
MILPDERIEPMTINVNMPLLKSSVSGALLVTAHPSRWPAKETNQKWRCVILCCIGGVCSIDHS